MPLFKEFFDYAMERHFIYLRRQAGKPPPFTKDPILRHYRFTNVYREFDETTKWFREHVREPMRNEPEVVQATCVFRMFNRISVGEVVFCQTDLFDGLNVFRQFLKKPSWKLLNDQIRKMIPDGPWVTGAYTIATPNGMNKLEGVCRIVENICNVYARDSYNGPRTLQDFCKWLAQQWYFGPFHAYEVACDLRYTHFLKNAPDKMSWANLGPGAKRGLNRIHERPTKGPLREAQAIEEMQEILELSENKDYWRGYPPWEMREVEHTLCEFDKYNRCKNGEGQTRGIFHGGEPR